MSKYNDLEGVAAKFTFVVIFMVVLFGLSYVMAFPIKWLWNGLLPAIFGFKVITTNQAWGLIWLLSFLSPIRWSSIKD